MRKSLYLTSFAVILTLAVAGQSLKYRVDLNTPQDDAFKIQEDVFRVTLEVSGLTKTNDIYQFASTAPGTYQVMDIGRFVRNFKAFDQKEKEIEVKKISDNQYQLTHPKKVRKIVYQIAETWDTPVDKNVVYKMCGSSIEKDHVLINGQCVFGYPKGMQGVPMELRLDYPGTWTVGTALAKNQDGNYVAANFDQMVDSPILMGRLTKASTTIGKANIDIYTYSKTDLIKSDDLLKSMESMLKAADAFLGGLPVDRYTFLFHFEDESWGAWEHSYSSEYVLQEQNYTPDYGQAVTSTAAHEFFHIVTPLNIHSNIIESFNFVTPTPSEHLWLYEGTTEWASDLMQLRSGMMSLEAFLGELKQKLFYDSQYDTSYSLSKLALTSFTEDGQRQYANIYMRGALVAGLLDIRLLELSGGKKGLREVIRSLAQQYGPHKAFPENDFFRIFTEMTYPEIADFFNQYVRTAHPLPIGEYYAKLGILYTPEVKTGKVVSTLGMGLDVPDGKIHLVRLRAELKELGMMDDDELIAINGTTITLSNGRKIITDLSLQPIGTEYSITVSRASGQVTLKSTVLSKEETKQFVFELDPNASEQQIALRKVWMKNL